MIIGKEYQVKRGTQTLKVELLKLVAEEKIYEAAYRIDCIVAQLSRASAIPFFDCYLITAN